jgi:hypothetical protein
MHFESLRESDVELCRFGAHDAQAPPSTTAASFLEHHAARQRPTAARPSQAPKLALSTMPRYVDPCAGFTRCFNRLHYVHLRTDTSAPPARASVSVSACSARSLRRLRSFTIRAIVFLSTAVTSRVCRCPKAVKRGDSLSVLLASASDAVSSAYPPSRNTACRCGLYPFGYHAACEFQVRRRALDRDDRSTLAARALLVESNHRLDEEAR